ncbi:MAG: hypothetical protein ABIY47_03115 [Opitutaceae bacterium]
MSSRPSTQVAENFAYRREKTAGVASSGFNKMERAKRLELNDLQMQQSQHVTDTPTLSPANTATITPGQELAEIIAAWTKLPPEIRTAVLTLVRLSKLDAT